MASNNSINNTSPSAFTIGSGNCTISSGNAVVTSGNCLLPTTSSTVGQIQINATPVFHSYGTNNLFIGASAGNFTFTTAQATANVAVGPLALNAITGGQTASDSRNTAVGYGAMQYAYGSAAGYCVSNVAIGTQCMGSSNNANSQLQYNVCIGDKAGYAINSNNVVIGYQAVAASTSYDINRNVIVGYQAGNAIATGSNDNVIIGYQAFLGGVASVPLQSVIIGGSSGKNILGAASYNTFIGANTGSSYTTTESSNILIGYNTTGTVGESNVCRIGNGTGTSTNGNIGKTWIAGIRGITTVNNDAVAVLIDSVGQLGTTSSSIKFKENVIDMGDNSNGLLQLRPVCFNYKEEDPSIKRFGLIAEEVAVVIPELAATDSDGQIFSVKYHDLPAMLLNEIKKLSARIESLEAQLAAKG
jgi:Chaperone of endosialidase